MTGLNAIFQHAYKEGKIPDKETAQYLVSQLGEVNYIPPNSVREYEHAILKHYEEYFAVMEKRRKENDPAKKKNG